MDCIESTSDLKYSFSRFLPYYDRKTKYITSMNLNSKDIAIFIEKYCVDGNSTTCIDSSALNLVIFFMHENRKLLAESAYQMCQYAKKSSVNDRAFLYSIKTVYPEGDLQKALYAKAEDASYKARKVEVTTKKTSDDSDKQEKNNKKNDKEKSKDKQKDAKKTGKKQVKEESDDESDNDYNDESDNESNDGSDDGSDDDSSDGSDNDSDDGNNSD